MDSEEKNTSSTSDSEKTEPSNNSQQEFDDFIKYLKERDEKIEKYNQDKDQKFLAKLDTLISQTQPADSANAKTSNDFSMYADACIIFLILGVFPIYFMYRFIRSHLSLLNNFI